VKPEQAESEVADADPPSYPGRPHGWGSNRQVHSFDHAAVVGMARLEVGSVKRESYRSVGSGLHAHLGRRLRWGSDGEAPYGRPF
jgi:hypothetical protein